MSLKQKQNFDFFVAVDFQITQLSGQPHQKEITEINAVAVNAINFDCRKIFAGCCHPDLPNFSFEDALRKFIQWLRQLNGSYVLVTDQNDALASDFPKQCLRSGIDVPRFATEWFNVTEFWMKRYGNRQVVTCNLLLEQFGKNRILEKGKQTSQSNVRSLSIVVADVIKAHPNFLFQPNTRLQCVEI